MDKAIEHASIDATLNLSVVQEKTREVCATGVDNMTMERAWPYLKRLAESRPGETIFDESPKNEHCVDQSWRRLTSPKRLSQSTQGVKNSRR